MSEPSWLVALRGELVELTRGPAATMWPVPPGCTGPYFNYRVEHVKQVERNALRLLRHVEADADVVLAAVWIHDRIQPLFQAERHGQRAADWAESSLAALGFPAEKVAAVCAAVARHSEPPGSLADASVEARVVWDADKLAHFSLVGVLCVLLNNLAADRVLERQQDGRYDPADGVLAQIVAGRLGTFLELTWDPQSFYFPASRELGEAERRTQHLVLEELRRELDPTS